MTLPELKSAITASLRAGPLRRDQIAADISTDSWACLSASRQLSQALDELRREGAIAWTAGEGWSVGELRVSAECARLLGARRAPGRAGGTR